LSLLHIAKAGAEYQCFAPDIMQMHTINHLTGEEMASDRNVLVEAARIARGEIKPITELDAADFDALILPGGFGAAKNLSDFAVKGAQAHVQTDVLKACKTFADNNKPAGYMCITPALIPLIYSANAKVTIGDDQDTASAINALGAEHVACPVSEIIIDQQHKLVTTPAYMLAESILEADAGIEKLVTAVLKMC
ncbi:isoprenoid biosynthesis glyoxalase ElbB, partial [Pseudoalteromonas sp.]